MRKKAGAEVTNKDVPVRNDAEEKTAWGSARLVMGNGGKEVGVQLGGCSGAQRRSKSTSSQHVYLGHGFAAFSHCPRKLVNAKSAYGIAINHGQRIEPYTVQYWMNDLPFTAKAVTSVRPTCSAP
jgi:hypothetical protein